MYLEEVSELIHENTISVFMDEYTCTLFGAVSQFVIV